MKILINNNISSMNLPVIYSNDKGFLLEEGLFNTIKVKIAYAFFRKIIISGNFRCKIKISY